MAAAEDVVSNLKALVQNISAIYRVLNFAFPGSGEATANTTGTFQLFLGDTERVINNAGITSTTKVFISPANAAAATLMVTVGVYVSSVGPGSSFTVDVLSGGAAGGEIFSYQVVN